MSQQGKQKDEESNAHEKSDQMTLKDVPSLFYDSPTPESCILTILSELPPIFDETFDDALLKKIELAESSITIVAEHLTHDVLSSQQQIFDATNTFISLNDNIFESSNFIHSIRDQVLNVREQTLTPILNILKYVRDLRRDTKSLTVLHFIRCITLIFDALNSSNLVWASYTLLQIQYLLYKEKSIYSLQLFDSFIGFTFTPLPTNVLSNNIPIQITIGELKKVKCIKNMISDIISFSPVLMSKMDRQLISDLSSNGSPFENSKYSVIVVSYCLINDHPPIAKVLFDKSTKIIRQQSIAYFETKSNDLQTLFRFMENACSIIENFSHFIQFHNNHQTFGSIVSELPIDIDVALLEKLPPDKDMIEKVKGIENDFNTYFTQLSNVAESNVLQFLSRLKIATLDALSFIQLVRALKEFNSFVKCSGLNDWISITTDSFLKNYSSVSTTSVKKAVASDSWVPTQTEDGFIQLVQTMPNRPNKASKQDESNEKEQNDKSILKNQNDTDNDIECTFNFNNSYKDKAFSAFASSSAITTVRVVHSLICLSMELDSDTCLNLIVQVSIYFVTCVMSIFSNPQHIFIENNNSNNDNEMMLNPNFILFLVPEFSNAVNQMLRLLNDCTNISKNANSKSKDSSSNSLFSLSQSFSQLVFQPSSSNLPNSNEAQLMQMVTATDGLELLLWYLNGIRDNIIKRSKTKKGTLSRSNTQYLAERVNLFYKYVVDIVIPGFMKNMSAIVMKNSGFLQIKNLKHQLQSSTWDLDEVTIEYHPFVSLAKKAFDRLDQTLMNLQLKRSIMNDIYIGTWAYLSQELISAFANVRNCNSFGRTLMAADTKKIGELFQSVSKIEANTSLVLEYVNAFFFQVNEFSKWIERAPGRFKQKHIVALVKTGLNIKLSSTDSKALLAKIESRYAASLRV